MFHRRLKPQNFLNSRPLGSPKHKIVYLNKPKNPNDSVKNNQNKRQFRVGHLLLKDKEGEKKIIKQIFQRLKATDPTAERSFSHNPFHLSNNLNQNL